MARIDGKVALITGAARGQGRAHAVRLAEVGADIVAVDLTSQIASVPYGLATSEDLAQTVKLVEGRGRRILPLEADVRDQGALHAVVVDATAEFGHIDVVVTNAGIVSYGRTWELSETQWRDVIDVNLTGVWHTVKAVVPSMIKAGRGGSIIISSTAGSDGLARVAHYAAAEHGLIGLMRTLASELAEQHIRVNVVNPAPDELPGRDDPTSRQRYGATPLPGTGVGDAGEAVLWLASDASFVTGAVLPVEVALAR
jgi:NAD(P)-dependent dehydrogenase (short-subunit alcohol dehydrogenase family)